MNIQDFMTQGVATVRADDTLHTAARAMWEHDCGALPVVERDGTVVAMITDRDACMASYFQGKPLVEIRVETAMSRNLVTCRPHDSLAAVEARMRDHQVRRLPVIDDMGRLLGIVSLNDIALEAVGKRSTSDGELVVEEMAATFAAICRHHNLPRTAPKHGKDAELS